MRVDNLLKRALDLDFLSVEEGVFLFENAPTPELMFVGNELRKQKIPNDIVTWIIDRNANTTNVCIASCQFCNFYRPPGHKEAYITTLESYKQKIEETFRLGGEQLLLQGGHHPDLGLEYYEGLFKALKKMYPKLKLHALGPPEIDHIAQLGGHTHTHVLKTLMKAGLDSLPGAGAEILDDEVRKSISRGKCDGRTWLNVMRAAHQLHLTTSATMMFGHVETNQQRMQHFVDLRQVQSEKPDNAKGFLAFIPWPFMSEGTSLGASQRLQSRKMVTGDEYVRMIAMSRIMLPNITNIQASWLTVGKKTGQICLHAGANDFGSIMIEENVVSAAGADYQFDATGIQNAIKEAGFTPKLRNQEYEFRATTLNV